jgi:hypothetical protein
MVPLGRAFLLVCVRHFNVAGGAAFFRVTA